MAGAIDWSEQDIQGGDVVVRATLQAVLGIYTQWRANDLRELAHAHEIRLNSRDTSIILIDRLNRHGCGLCCPPVVLIFRPLQRPCNDAQIARNRMPPPTAQSNPGTSYMEVASVELRRTIIEEWQEAIATDKFKTLVCGPCGWRTPSNEITLVNPSDFDLSLLRNDGLPPRVKPSTYNFVAYQEALLNPKGLTDLHRLGNVRMCEACRRALVDKHRMPRLCLANWLYYGYDELPVQVKKAFDTSTFTERLLLGRARCSRISYRFTELRQKNRDTDGTERSQTVPSCERHARSQKCVKGNVLVMPQNSTQLQCVLPPPPEVVKDTVCAVFVGKSKPTKETIGKIRPLLVRKSRMLCMIEFVTGENAHYSGGSQFQGFSQHNLDTLFGPGTEDQEEGVPCGLEIGFVEESDAIRAATADYTDRDNVDPTPSNNPDSLLMENVGYTMGDESPVSYRDMKMKALTHCLENGRFVRSRSGDRFVPDFENPSLLTWLFPHLDPWGIGGFHEPAREVPISMADQLKYMLQLDDGRFERDPNFAFVYYNILQKKAVCDSVRFRVKLSDQSWIVRELLAVDRTELERLMGKFKSNPKYEPEAAGEKDLVNLVNRVGMMIHDLPGTTGYKLKLRNEIRAMVNMRGTPAFFITLNPSDRDHPLVRLFAGDNIRLEALEDGQDLTEWDRRLLVARNPGPCAKFFHTMVSSFFSIVLRYGKPGKGLLGKCTGYYGTVETQGRGTLHCHILVWLEGHPSPQQMRDSMDESTQYQNDMFVWLESLIKCELLGTTMVVSESGVPLPRPDTSKLEGYIHPGTTLGPSAVNIAEDKFWAQFASDVNDVVIHANWHQHTETCWKNLRRGEARTDEMCRMRMDGKTRESTAVDEETGSILLRRLHPRIANYNDVIIFLLRANMDIKHIGSGEGAKALIYYVTDYITKAALPTHVGLAALLYAINRTKEKCNHVVDWTPAQSTGALAVVVNSMMARQEIPHQQVMSYLVGGGDHYKSDKFRVLHYGTFDRLVQRYWFHEDEYHHGRENDNEIHGRRQTEDGVADTTVRDGVDVTEASLNSLHRDDDTVTLLLGSGSISAVNQHQDYIYRPEEEPFTRMGIYEYVGMTEKITKSKESLRILRRRPDNENLGGRPEEARAEFSDEHPQHNTHMVRKRTTWVIPVLLGERIPRHDRSKEEREKWARTILTLFIPWRHPSDLKEPEETWAEAYERHAPSISQHHMAIIHNMNVLSECRDARDKASLARKMKQPVPNRVIGPLAPDPFDVYEGNPDQRRDGMDTQCDHEELLEPSTLVSELDRQVGARFRHAIDKCYSVGGGSVQNVGTSGTTAVLTDERRHDIDSDHAAMQQLKRKRHPDVNVDGIQSNDRNVRPRMNRLPRVDIATLTNGLPTASTSEEYAPRFDPEDLIYQVVLEKNLRSNPEQLRAFEIVGRHVTRGGPQLLMYVGGVGGTGKSHVVNSILRLFSLLGKRNNILVAAPTGAAAILIGGHTIHSLTMLPDGPGRDFQELSRIWEDVDYLILDEVSMIGGKLMSQINARIMRARAQDERNSDLPFGGLNVIFTGDFGQLRPVKDPSLYSHSLVENPALDTCWGKRGISALLGVHIWRRVNKVVILKINQRQANDKLYSELLNRVRVGEANTNDHDGIPSDFSILKTRYIDRIAFNDPTSLARFKDSPVIVGRKRIRDLLNLRLMGHHAVQISAEIYLYHAKDKIGGQTVSNGDREPLWRQSSSVTNDSLGKLPLFPGMKVMIQENLAFTNGVVNGSEGVIVDIVYEEDNGKRFPVVVYVRIPGAGSVSDRAEEDVVPIFPQWTSFIWNRTPGCNESGVSVSRLQLPLLPAYAYTDYKAQGRSLDAAIIDPASAASLQGIYVMLSRVRELKGVAILRPFCARKIDQRLSQELRTEIRRLDVLDVETRNREKIGYNPSVE